MNRKPIYHKDDPRWRIISVPNGLWQAQYRTREPNFRDNRIDPYVAMGQPRSQPEALAQMDELAKGFRKT